MSHLRRTYSIFLIVTFLGIATFLFVALAQVVVYFKTGAEKSKKELISAEDISVFYKPKVNWTGLLTAEGRAMEEKTLEKITRDYLAGEYYKQEFQRLGNLKGIHDYYAEQPREHLIKLASHSSTLDQQQISTGLEHDFKLNFYSEDGTLIVMEDEAISYQQVTLGNQTVELYDSATYDVMLLLEDNFWRVRHKVRRGVSKVAANTDKSATPCITIKGKQFLKQGQPHKLKGINYYPQAYPWHLMWGNIDSVDLQNDFKKLDQLGINMIRIFVPYTEFGESEVTQEKLNALTALMDVAHQNNLDVLITLFDFFLEYDVSRWTLSDRHAEQIVLHLKSHPALLGWDLKNEPDLDFEVYSREKVIQWLEFMAKRIKGYDPNHLITIGWSQPEVSNILADVVDFASFHFFRDPSELANYLETNNGNFAKPLFLGETGMHSYNAWWFPFGKSEQDQHDYLKEVLRSSSKYDLNYAIWTLYDFNDIPNNVAGKVPWRKNPQKRYGLINTKNEPKPAYTLIQKFNHGRQ